MLVKTKTFKMFVMSLKCVLFMSVIINCAIVLKIHLSCIVLYCIVFIYLKGFSKSKWMLITEVSHINNARKMGKWGGEESGR